eukprot:TRINITY_DN37758_c0_g1_i1.p1 TRINITY_DN37758_c0_g1~~TRINITY_DN37758_c0_g1_i1.p1  ORF type:complete len:528 (+),score=69.48 TRINITY_DN37758_c0_g1_i1:92-1585(+)
MANLCCSLQNFFSHFYTNKKVVFQSRALKVPEVIVLLLICAYIFNELVIKLRYLKDVTYIGEVNLRITQPQANWDYCHDEALDCDDVDYEWKPLRKVKWCEEDELKRLNQMASEYFLSRLTSEARNEHVHSLQISCKSFDTTDVVVPTGGGSIFITTALQKVTQQRCQDASCRWKNTNIKTYLVENVGDMRLKIHHTWTSDFAGNKLDSDRVIGMLRYRNGSTKVIGCGDAYKHKSDMCTSVDEQFGFMERCGTSTSRNSTCFATQTSDFIDIQYLLDTINIDLDASTAWGNLPYRFWGMDILFHLYLTSGEPSEFWSELWHRGPHLIPRYMYSFRESSTGYFPTESVEYLDDSMRILTIKRGIQISMNTFGAQKEFDAWYSFLQLMATVFVLKFAKEFVDHVLVRFYMCLPSMRHVFIMHEHYRLEVHLEEEEFKGALEQRSSYDDLAEQEKKKRAEQHDGLVEKHHKMEGGLLGENMLLSRNFGAISDSDESLGA